MLIDFAAERADEEDTAGGADDLTQPRGIQIMSHDTFPTPATPPGMTDAEWTKLCAEQDVWRQNKRDAEAKEARELARAADFRTDCEGGWSPGFGDDKGPAALVFNPSGTPLALAAAALSRADCLHKSLDAWSTVSAALVDVAEVAGALEPIAQEVELLLRELTDRLNKLSRNAGAVNPS